MKTYSITDFKTGGTAPSLYNTVGFGAVKHGDNQQKNIISQLGTFQQATTTASGATMGDLKLRAFEVYNNELYAAGVVPFSTSGLLWHYSGGNWLGVGASHGAGAEGAFRYYQSNFYGYRQSQYIWKTNDIGTVINDTYQTLSSPWTTTAPPVVHSGGKILYFFTDGNVHQLRDATFTENVIQFQSGFTITNACEYGNYLIICGYETKTGRATAAFWDRDSSLARITNIVDLGFGIPKAVATLDGTPTVVMISLDASQLFIRQFDTNSFVTRNTYKSTPSNFFVGLSNWVQDNRMFVPVYGKLRADDQDYQANILAVNSDGRIYHLASGSYNTNMDAVAFWNNQYHVTSATNSTYLTSTNLYSQPLIYETLAIKPIASDRVKLHAATVQTTPLASGGTCVIKARKNGETTWQTIHTSTTTGEMTHSVTQAMARSAGISIGDAKLLQLRAELTGGGDITGLQYVIDTDSNKEPYERGN